MHTTITWLLCMAGGEKGLILMILVVNKLMVWGVGATPLGRVLGYG
jgi:hypothetical protein